MRGRAQPPGEIVGRLHCKPAVATPLLLPDTLALNKKSYSLVCADIAAASGVGLGTWKEHKGGQNSAAAATHPHQKDGRAGQAAQPAPPTRPTAISDPLQTASESRWDANRGRPTRRTLPDRLCSPRTRGNRHLRFRCEPRHHLLAWPLLGAQKKRETSQTGPAVQLLSACASPGRGCGAGSRVETWVVQCSVQGVS